MPRASALRLVRHLADANRYNRARNEELDQDECVTSLRAALQRYMDLMSDCDVSRFDDEFAPTAQLHGFRNGAMQCWPAEVYRDILAKRESPKSLGARREEAN